jgi:hypothetical protein
MVTPGEVRITWNWLNATRRIYTDGRPHPKGDDLLPSFMGHSIGHWEGDTLVVDTIGMMAGIYDQSEAPHSDKVHLTERIRMIDASTLEDQMTIEDPVAVTRPWHVVRHYDRAKPETRIGDLYCDSDRNPVVNGQVQVVLNAPVVAPGDPEHDRLALEAAQESARAKAAQPAK